MEKPPTTVAMTFAGGLGLAAYHAGVYEAFARRTTPLHWVTGSSAGAVTAALIAGNPPDQRTEQLRAFWNAPDVDVDVASPEPWRHWLGWLGAVRTRLTGSPGQFNPRIPS